MMTIDIGKSAKRMGATHPRDARKIDACKPTVGLGSTIALKNFGYTYQWRWRVNHGWRTRTRWFKTEKSRDQALAHFRSVNWDDAYRRNVEKIDR